MTVLYKAASTMVTSGKKVRFDVKKIDQVQYAKYIQREKRSPRYRPHKIKLARPLMN